MEYRELFERLKRDGDEWMDFYWLFNVPEEEWKLFGWLWERAQEKEWWEEFIDRHGNMMEHTHTVCTSYINPTRFTEALKQYLDK